MSELATVRPSTGALALHADQHEWNPDQQAALAQLGLSEATPGDLNLFRHVCQRTGLDPFSRQIYMIKRWDSQASTNKWTIQTGIDGLRIIADRRTGLYAGQTDPQWCGEDGVWRDFWVGSRPPVAARVGVIRRDFDRPIMAVAMFMEYAQTKRGGDLTHMWAEKPALMIAKCAEALALRKAFPNDLAGLMTPEEMDRDDRPAGRVVAQSERRPVTTQELTRGATPEPQSATDEQVVEGDTNGAITKAQLTKLAVTLKEAGVTDRDRGLKLESILTGRDITSSKDLTKLEASNIIDHLERLNSDDVNAIIDGDGDQQ